MKRAQWLLPALDAAGETAVTAQTRAEHAELRRLVAADVRAFAMLLERHIRFEERTLFESAQRKLDLATLR